jgi:hypothetical protein
LSVKNDPSLDDSKVNWVPFITGFTAGGVAIGALIGACYPRWKPFYIRDQKTTFFFKISPVVNQNTCGLGLIVNF